MRMRMPFQVCAALAKIAPFLVILSMWIVKMDSKNSAQNWRKFVRFDH
jgi:hypothetical protein